MILIIIVTDTCIGSLGTDQQESLVMKHNLNREIRYMVYGTLRVVGY